MDEVKAMYGHFMTDRGQKRITNEDSGGIFTNQAGQLLAIVADGMGGHKAGEIASQLAVNYIKEQWEKNKKITTPKNAEAWLYKTMQRINRHIYEEAQANEEYNGMGTTVVISLCTKEFVTIAHIGDSRCYLLNECQFEQITDDHSLVNELVRTGQISKNDAAKHPRKNVLLRAVGTEEEVDADIKTINWSLGDRLLLCSDGLTNKITDEEIETYLREVEALDEVVKEFIHLANERGGEDNITLAVIEKKSSDKVGDTSC